MRRFTAAALLCFGMAFPLCAQRGSSHGGSGGGHAGGFAGGSASHGGFRSSAPSRSGGFTPSSRYVGSRPGFTPRYAPGARSGAYPRTSSGSPGIYLGRPAYATNGPYRSSPYRQAYRSGRSGSDGRGNWRRRYWPGTYVWGVPWVGDYGGWLDSGFDSGFYDDGDGYDSGYNDVGPAPDQSYTPYLPYNQGQPYDPSYDPGYDSGHPGQSYSGQAGPPPQNQQTVTLVFKDHRPNQQIHNYLLNGTTLSVWDQHPREIPVDQIDIPETQRLNSSAGVDFHLPVQP